MNDEIAMIMEMNMEHAEKCDWHMHWTKWIFKWWKVWMAYALNKVNIEVINDTWMMSSGQYESIGYMRMIHEQKWAESEEMIKRLLSIVLHILCALHTT